MTEDGLKPLIGLAQAEFDKAQAEFNRIKARENSLRGQIKELDDMTARAAMTDPESMQRLQKLGAQEIWLAWTRRKRADLNKHLAGVLLQQEGARAKLREAFGRREALEALLEKAKRARKARIEKRREEQIMQPYLIASMRERF